MKTIFLVFFCSIFIAGCKMESINIIGRYNLETSEGDRYVLEYRLTEDGDGIVLVDLYVNSISLDSNYIVVTRRPNLQDKNDTILFYYIVPIYRNFTYSPDKGEIGPMFADEFKEEKPS